MKKTILFLAILFSAVFVHADGVGMAEFRKAQRQLVLADFKTLYKQRHLSAHKAQLRHKHRRVKKIAHQTVLQNVHKPSLQEKTQIDITADGDVSQAHFENAAMQTQANHDMGTIADGSSYKIDINDKSNIGGGHVPADVGDGGPVSVGNGDGGFNPGDTGSGFEPPDTGGINHDTGPGDGGPGNIADGTGSSGIDGINQGGSGDSGHGSDYTTAPSETGGGPSSGGGGVATDGTDDPGTGGMDQESGADGSDSKPGNMDGAGTSNTANPGIRPLYASPWGRR
jgi:hypothetical protein